MSREYDNYDIICIKKTWADTTAIKDVNLFSGVEPETTEQIDLKDYLMDISEISYDFDEAEKENGQNQLFYVASDMNMTLSGIANSEYLKTYFGVFSNTDYIKWHVKIIDVSSTIWEGIINHESIKLGLKPEVSSDEISVTVLSFEKEFKEYFSQRDLTEALLFSTIGGINALSKTVGGLVNGGTRLASQLSRVLPNLFPNTTWNMETGLSDWYIVHDPVLSPKDNVYGTNENYIFIKSSIERIQTNGENCYDFLRRICNSMGWVFYYQFGMFNIKNRATDIPTLTELDVNELIEVEVSKYREVNAFAHIGILDGTIDGGNNTGGNTGDVEGEDLRAYQMRGARLQLISDVNGKQLRGGTWWQNMTGFLLNVFAINDTFFRYYNEDDTTFNISFHTKTGMYGLTPIWEAERNGMAKSDILFIDAGDTGNLMWLYDVSNGYNSAHSADATSPAPINQWTANRVRFKGCYGNCMAKLVNSGGWKFSYTYQDYVKENLFYDNFQKFFQSRQTRKINIKYNALITNPIQVFTFTNDTDGLYTGEWVINSMKFDLLEETTEFELQRKTE